jgi:hypothetical protein
MLGLATIYGQRYGLHAPQPFLTKSSHQQQIQISDCELTVDTKAQHEHEAAADISKLRNLEISGISRQPQISVFSSSATHKRRKLLEQVPQSRAVLNFLALIHNHWQQTAVLKSTSD